MYICLCVKYFQSYIYIQNTNVDLARQYKGLHSIKYDLAQKHLNAESNGPCNTSLFLTEGEREKYLTTIRSMLRVIDHVIIQTKYQATSHIK